MTAEQRERILADIYIELDDTRRTMLADDGRSKVDCIDVRLQLISPDEYSVKCGDASYDTDHRGYWGASSVSADDTDSDLEATAEDLLEQALDHAAQCDEDWAQDDDEATPRLSDTTDVSLPADFIDQDHDGLA